MSNLSKLALIKEMIDSAESSLRSAKQLLIEATGGAHPAFVKQSYANAASGLSASVTGEGKVVEGVFDGQSMIGPDKRSYPIPANYASKSKLVPGDVLKLTITDDGSFLYKQIGPVERKRIIGPLTQEDGQYKVIAGGKAYKVLLASITFFRAEPGDQVAILVPENGESEWGAVDNVVPRIQAEMQAEESIVKEAKKTAKKAVEEIDLGSIHDED
jgi:hypothetical protein